MKTTIKTCLFTVCVAVCLLCGVSTANSAYAKPFYSLKTDEYVLKGEFCTYYAKSPLERKHNVSLAVRAINNTLVDSGEEFSFNRATGERGQKQGYKTAKIIIDGEYVEGVGGGVCQVSTTLYNAVLLSGLRVSEYHAHSLPVSYVKPSFDAMVCYGVADLRFINNTSSPVIVQAIADGEKITCRILGQKSEFDIVRESQVTEQIAPNSPVVIKDVDNKYNLQSGEEKIIRYAKFGIKSKASLLYYRNGKLVKKVTFRENTYKPQEQLSYIGI